LFSEEAGWQGGDAKDGWWSRGREGWSEDTGVETGSETGMSVFSMLDAEGPPYPAVATLVVKGLPAIATEKNLRSLFGREWITLGRVTICSEQGPGGASCCKGYAFADLSDLEQAHHAVQQLNGFDADGFRLCVEVYKKYSQDGGPGTQGRWVLGAGRGKSAGSRSGEVTNGQAVVEPSLSTKPSTSAPSHGGERPGASDRPGADKDHRHSGQGLPDRDKGLDRVTDRGRGPRGGEGTKNIDGNTRLFVGNISSQCNEDQLKSEFSKVGEVAKVRLVMDRETSRPKGFGFVEFVKAEDVDGAMRRMQGAEICGKPVRLALPSVPGRGLPPASKSGPSGSDGKSTPATADSREPPVKALASVSPGRENMPSPKSSRKRTSSHSRSPSRSQKVGRQAQERVIDAGKPSACPHPAE